MSFCYTALRLAAVKPLCRRLSAASPSFRMPGQDCAVTDLTKTFDAFRAALDRQLIVGRAGGLRKLVELFLQVKDLFLQIYYVPGAELR